MCSNIGLKLLLVPGLNKDTSRTCKSTDEAFAGLHAAHGTAASLLDLVVAAPGHEMAVVDNVRLTGLELDSQY